MSWSRQVANMIERQKREVAEHLQVCMGYGIKKYPSTLLVQYVRDFKVPSSSFILELSSPSTNPPAGRVLPLIVHSDLLDSKIVGDV